MVEQRNDAFLTSHFLRDSFYSLSNSKYVGKYEINKKNSDIGKQFSDSTIT